MSDFLKVVYRRALTAGDPSLVQLSFDMALLDRYRQQRNFQIIRTNTAGRIRKEGGWSVDVGIAPDERTIHASWQMLAYAVPEDERGHWAQHAVQPSGYSDNFLRMQFSPGSCFDDGELRTW